MQDLQQKAFHSPNAPGGKTRRPRVCRQTLSAWIFWTGFALLLGIGCVDSTSLLYSGAAWMKGMYALRNLLYLALLAKAAFLTTYRREELLGVGIVFAVGFASLVGSGDFGLLKLALVAVAAKDASPRRLVSVFAAIKGAAFAGTLLLWRVGVLPALYYPDDRVGYYNTYGFCHRNVLGANAAVLCLAWFYLRYDRLKLGDVLIWSGLALLTYRLALSRTCLLLMLLTIFGMAVFQSKEAFWMRLPGMRRLLLGGACGLLILSVLCMLFYAPDRPLWVLLDRVFTKRIRFAHLCFAEYGLSLFGQPIPFVSSMQAQAGDAERLILDNAYIRAILYYGLIPAALFFAAYFKALGLSFRKKDCALLLSLLVFAVYGLSERYMLDVQYQFPFLVACGQLFFRHRPAGKRERRLKNLKRSAKT